MSTPLVTILVPTYNQASFLAETLDSCLAQDVPMEILVGDDASTDGTQDIARDYANRHPGVVIPLLHDTNQGISANMQRLIDAVRGEFIAFLSGDDLMLADKLQKQVAYFRSHPGVVLCYHDLEWFDSETGKTLRHHNSPHEPGATFFPPREGGAETLLRHGNYLGGCSVMIRAGARPADGYNHLLKASDWLFFIETAMAGTIGYLPEILGRYRRHENSFMNQLAAQTGRRMVEPHLTLAIVDGKYPHLAPHTRVQRAELLYHQATELYASGDRRHYHRPFREALRGGGVPPGGLWWYVKQQVRRVLPGGGP